MKRTLIISTNAGEMVKLIIRKGHNAGQETERDRFSTALIGFLKKYGFKVEERKEGNG